MMKKTKAKAVKPVEEYLDCYYMTEKAIGIWELYESYQEALPLMAKRTQLWAEAGVIELELGEKSSIDIELLDWFSGEEDEHFLKKHGIQTIFGIRTQFKNRDIVLELFRTIQERLGGFVCSDTRDFMPVLL